jgi:hypothetical protein
MKARWFAACALLFIPAAALFAQQSDRQHVIAVSVDSTDSRIQQMIPELREKAAFAIEQSAKNVSATIVMGSPLDVAEQARQKSADYLITIDLSLLSQVGSRGGIGRGPANTADVPMIGGVPSGLAHSRCQDLINEAFEFSYKVTSLAGEKIKVQGSHTMQESEYPLGPEYNCLGKFSTQAVRVSAADAVKGLKSKKKI